MISAIAAVVLLSPQAPAGQLTGSQIFSKMLERYHSATTVRGTIEMRQSAARAAEVVIRTTVQAKKPNLFFVEQVRTPRSDDPNIPSHFQAVSDGKTMTYTIPPNALPLLTQRRLHETAPESLDGGLNAFCTFVLDRDLPLAIALYNGYEVQRVVSRLANLTLLEDVTIGDKTVWQIRAGYGTAYTNRPTVYTPITYFIDKQFNLVGILREDIIMSGSQQIDIVTRWHLGLEVNGSVDDSLFRVR